jgi:hypothetical protein
MVTEEPPELPDRVGEPETLGPVENSAVRRERFVVYGGLLVGVLAAVASIVSAAVANVAISEAREERDLDRRDQCLESVLAASTDLGLTDDRWRQGIRDRDRDITGLMLHSELFIRCRSFVPGESELWTEVGEAANAYGALAALDTTEPPDGADPVIERYGTALDALLDYVGEERDKEGIEATMPPE